VWKQSQKKYIREMADIDFSGLPTEHKDNDPHSQTPLKVIGTDCRGYRRDKVGMLE